MQRSGTGGGLAAGRTPARPAALRPAVLVRSNDAAAASLQDMEAQTEDAPRQPQQVVVQTPPPGLQRQLRDVPEVQPAEMLQPELEPRITVRVIRQTQQQQEPRKWAWGCFGM